MILDTASAVVLTWMVVSITFVVAALRYLSLSQSASILKTKQKLSKSFTKTGHQAPIGSEESWILLSSIVKKMTEASIVRFDLTGANGPQVVVAGKYIAIRHPSWIEVYQLELGQWYPMICWNRGSLDLLDGDWTIFKTKKDKVKGSIGKNLLPGQVNNYHDYLIACSKDISLAEINVILNKFYSKYLHSITAGEVC